LGAEQPGDRLEPFWGLDLGAKHGSLDGSGNHHLVLDGQDFIEPLRLRPSSMASRCNPDNSNYGFVFLDIEPAICA
jgi:hypothetical protein